MSDHEWTVADDVPLRTKLWPSERYEELDKGIRYAVRLLHSAGIETCQSCEGGDGHAYDHPSVDLPAAEDAAGFGAVSLLAGSGLPVKTVSQVWDLDAMGRPFQTLWRIEFARAFPEMAGREPMFVWGYQAQ